VKRHSFRAAAVAGALLLGATVAQIALADGGSTTLTGRGPSAIVVVSGPGPDSVAQTNWTDLPDAVATVKVPSGWSAAILDIRLSADFTMGANYGRGQIRVLVDGTEVAPGPLHISGDSASFDVPQLGSLERSTSVGPGSHTIKVQAQMCDCGDADLSMTNWTLTVERARSS
jgi:hypothetical protein